LDSDLAELYGVETRVLKQTVRRNRDRFPDDFIFKLTPDEWKTLRSQTVILKRGKHSKYPPYAFTEQGVAMLSSVLKSKRAIQVNIAIMRAFVQMRKFFQSQDELAAQLKKLEKSTTEKFKEQGKQIQLIFEAIKQLIVEKQKPRKPVGFIPPKKIEKNNKFFSLSCTLTLHPRYLSYQFFLISSTSFLCFLIK
jgi:phage regulator Rha-like protein